MGMAGPSGDTWWHAILDAALGLITLIAVTLASLVWQSKPSDKQVDKKIAEAIAESEKQSRELFGAKLDALQKPLEKVEQGVEFIRNKLIGKALDE